MLLSGGVSDWFLMIKFWLNTLARRLLGQWVSFSVHVVRSRGMPVVNITGDVGFHHSVNMVSARSL